MNIKVCGITSMKQLQQLDGLDVAFAGLIFYNQSPRYVGDKLSAKELVNADLDIKTVGVFVNAGYDEIMSTIETYELDIVQLHGNESPQLCEQVSDEVEVIKSFSISADTVAPIDELLKDYDDVCDYYLFDTASGNMPGGTGTKFDWNKIRTSKIEKPFFLSGGIQPTDGPLVKKFRHPDFYGIDVNSHFEKERGIKDMALVLQFVHSLR